MSVQLLGVFDKSEDSSVWAYGGTEVYDNEIIAVHFDRQTSLGEGLQYAHPPYASRGASDHITKFVLPEEAQTAYVVEIGYSHYDTFGSQEGLSEVAGVFADEEEAQKMVDALSDHFEQGQASWVFEFNGVVLCLYMDHVTEVTYSKVPVQSE